MGKPREPKSDRELLDRALKHWTDVQLHQGRKFPAGNTDGPGSANSFAREVLVCDPRSFRRWRSGERPVGQQVRAKCRHILGLDRPAEEA